MSSPLSVTSSPPTVPVDAPKSKVSDVVGAIRLLAGSLPQVDIVFEAGIRTLWVELKAEPKPVFTVPVIDSVRKVQGAVMQLWAHADECPVKFFAYRCKGSIFSLGGDLDFYLDCLARNDRHGLADYARIAGEVIALNNNGLKGLAITLATIQGKALGGGIDPARACNVLIGEESASFGYPEINYNHFPISAVPILSRHTGQIEAERILLSGIDYSAQEFFASGVLDAVVPDHTGEDWIRAYATRSLASHRARVALFTAFNRRSGNLQAELSEARDLWVDHMMSLTPLEISKLQRITTIQERMLSRLANRAPSEPTDARH